MQDIIHKLKVDIFNRAEFFLEENGEIAPFAATIFKDVVQPVAYDPQSDSLEIEDSNMVIDLFLNDFNEKFKENLIDGAAIAFDVIAEFKNADGIFEKRDALCLKFSTDGENWKIEYFPYMIIDGQCIWK